MSYTASVLGQVYSGRVGTGSELEPPRPGEDLTDGDHKVTKMNGLRCRQAFWPTSQQRRLEEVTHERSDVLAYSLSLARGLLCSPHQLAPVYTPKYIVGRIPAGVKQEEREALEEFFLWGKYIP